MGAFLFLMVTSLKVFEEFANFSVPATTKFSIRAHDGKTIDLLAYESIRKELKKLKNEGQYYNDKIIVDYALTAIVS